MSNNEDILNGALADFAKNFAQNTEVAGIIEQAQAGEIEEHVALHKLMELVLANPDLQQQLLKQAMTSLAPVAPEANESAGSYPQVYQPPSGMARMDPLLEAKLTERIQFDGDIPEIRSEAMREGVRPAVPVLNAPTNPVALGFSLETASDEVLAEVKALTQKVCDANTDNALIATNSGAAMMTQPTGYKPGELPALREVSSPTGAQLMMLPQAKQQELAWGSFSTTQGRRSAAPTLANMIEDKLRKKGHSNVSVSAHGGQMKNTKENIAAKAAWVISILGSGSLSTNEGFSVMENAAAALANELSENLDETSDLLSIEVCTVDTFEKRQVGWAALLRR